MVHKYNNSQELWLIPGVGVAERIDDNLWSNQSFVSTIKSDDSALGVFMQSKFSTPTRISISRDKDFLPENWEYWSASDILVDIDYIVSKYNSTLRDISGKKRLTLSRSQNIERYKTIIGDSSMVVEGKHIREGAKPNTINDAIIDAIFALQFIIERETTASFTKKVGKKGTSKDKIKSMEIVRDIVNDRDDKNLVNVFLFSTYIQPSPIGIMRIFEVGSVLGIEEAKEIIAQCYKKINVKQIECINSAIEELSL